MIFKDIKNALIAYKSEILLLSSQESLSVILNEIVNFEEELVEVYTDLVNLELFIQAANIQKSNIMGLIIEFRRQYVPFLVCKDAYKVTLEDRAYLQQHR